jgi:hypothetical protein
MDNRFSQRMLRALIIAIPCFFAGMFACGAMLSIGTRDAAMTYCISALFIGIVSFVVAWLIAGQIRKDRFVRVPRQEYFDDDLDEEKPKRG